MNRPDFYIASSEGYDMEEPRKAYRIKRLQGDIRDDFLLIKIDPPLIGQKYGLGEEDVDHIIVVARLKGDTLFPINKWPVFVYVLRPVVKDLNNRDVIRKDEYEIIAWAELYRTEEDACRKNLAVRENNGG